MEVWVYAERVVDAYYLFQIVILPQRLGNVSKTKRSVHIHRKAIWFTLSLYYLCYGNNWVELGVDRRRRQDGSTHKALLAAIKPRLSANDWPVIRDAPLCRAEAHICP